MLNLYFNVKLVEDSNIFKNFYNLSNFFHPAYYPNNFQTISISKIDQCLFSIESLDILKFNIAVFNISLVPDDQKTKKIFEKKIFEKIKAKKIIINWFRPSNKNEWINDTDQLVNLTNKDPVLVMMNHDHPLYPKYSDLFIKDVKNFFSKKKNYHQLMAYSHMPEMLEAHIKPNINIEDKTFKRKVTWVDSVYVMRAETLKLLFKRIVVPHPNFYLGRLDWNGVYIKPIILEFYIPTKPYFYHLGRYHHKSGINLEQFISLNKLYIYSQGKNIGDAYCEWFSHYYLYLFKIFKNKKVKIFKQEILNTLQHYFQYARVKDSKLSEWEKDGLASLIFSMFNSIYNLFDIEDKIIKKRLFFRNFLSVQNKIILKKWLKKIGVNI